MLREASSVFIFSFIQWHYYDLTMLQPTPALQYQKTLTVLQIENTEPAKMCCAPPSPSPTHPGFGPNTSLSVPASSFQHSSFFESSRYSLYSFHSFLAVFRKPSSHSDLPCYHLKNAVSHKQHKTSAFHTPLMLLLHCACLSNLIRKPCWSLSCPKTMYLRKGQPYP